MNPPGHLTFSVGPVFQDARHDKAATALRRAAQVIARFAAGVAKAMRGIAAACNRVRLAFRRLGLLAPTPAERRAFNASRRRARRADRRRVTRMLRAEQRHRRALRTA